MISDSKSITRFSFDSFIRFEDILVNFLAKYPEPYEFSPAGLSCETVVCRIRDGVRAYLEQDNQWQSKVDREILRSIWPNIICSHDGYEIYIGKPKKNLKGVVATRSTPTSGLVVENPSEQVIKALIILHSEGVLTIPTEFRMPDFPQKLQEAIKNLPNVELLHERDTFILI